LPNHLYRKKVGLKATATIPKNGAAAHQQKPPKHYHLHPEKFKNDGNDFGSAYLF
jgi:hypothetical protein